MHSSVGHLDTVFLGNVLTLSDGLLDWDILTGLLRDLLTLFITVIFMADLGNRLSNQENQEINGNIPLCSWLDILSHKLSRSQLNIPLCSP